jgi:hypothetical protein
MHPILDDNEVIRIEIMKFMNKVFLLLILSFAGNLFAAEGSPITNIAEIYSYSEYGGGDVVFSLKNPSANCDKGYWLKKSDPGFNANLSMLIAAYHAKTNVIVYGHINEIWDGSTGKYCHLYAINYR